MVVVTGATGTIGSDLLRLLVQRGVDVKALSRTPPSEASPEAVPGRSPSKAPPPGVEWVTADLSDHEALQGTCSGAERLFLLTGNVEDMVPLQKNAVTAAVKAGVPHVVKLSALGASDHSMSVIGVWHYIVEQALRGAGVRWTILRPHVFMQNLLDQRTSIRDEGKLYSPSGDAAIPMIDTRDIAGVAATILTEDGHDGKIYTLTGPEAIPFGEAAAVLTDVLGREVGFVSETYDDAWRRLRRAGLAPWHIGAQLALAGYQRRGGGTGIVTDVVERITGRPPRSFRDFARDYASAFMAE